MAEQTQFSVQLKLLDGYKFEIDFGDAGQIFSDEPPPLGAGDGLDVVACGVFHECHPRSLPEAGVNRYVDRAINHSGTFGHGRATGRGTGQPGA